MSNRVQKHLDPARSVLVALGAHADPALECDRMRLRKGIEVAAEVTERGESTVYRWMYRRENGGTGGQVPQADQVALLRYSREHGAGIDPAHFFTGEVIQQARTVRRKRTPRNSGRDIARPTG